MGLHNKAAREAENARETRRQSLAARLWEREGGVCLSSMVSTLAQGYGALENAPRLASRGREGVAQLSELCEQAFALASPIDDYEDAAIQAGWTQDGALWSHDDFAQAEVSAEAACAKSNIDPYAREVYEYWSVSSWLADELIAQGEKCDKDFADLCVRARTCTGQSICLDSVMQAIALELWGDK